MDDTEAKILWGDEICALVDAAFETVSRNPSDHEEAVAYRRAIASALKLRDAMGDALREALPFVERLASAQPTQPANVLRRNQAIKARDKMRDAISALEVAA